MKLTVLAATLFSAIALTVAAPAAEANATAEPIDKRGGNGASCGYSGGWYTVESWGSWDNDWGKGLLDNLRGQCGNIVNWGFNYGGNGNGYAGFAQSGRSHCVEDAIWLASNPTGAIWGLNCVPVS
ncbi:hypothetical protein FRB91_007317 [Serendipita sp. 411]|nr:hypothetical protein FRC20_008663 [Serendipita sp. 405]KAG8832093.1 hypothetical protein FRC18_005502 [Serendipita sp. 400]KAG8851876.1 hypothetical protein FRB91_007317 [Serendipita sp. 411]